MVCAVHLLARKSSLDRICNRVCFLLLACGWWCIRCVLYVVMLLCRSAFTHILWVLVISWCDADSQNSVLDIASENVWMCFLCIRQSRRWTLLPTKATVNADLLKHFSSLRHHWFLLPILFNDESCALPRSCCTCKTTFSIPVACLVHNLDQKVK